VFAAAFRPFTSYEAGASALYLFEHTLLPGHIGGPGLFCLYA
jgi:hypothetical protein